MTAAPVTVGWQPRANVHAELAADDARIALVAAGPADGVQHLAKALRQMTAKAAPTDPPGGLYVPLSWPAVVQLRNICGQAWRPGPRLVNWITRALAVRATAGTGLLNAPVPAGLTARPYQVEGARMIAATGRAVITDEPGTGKTITTILGLLELAHAGATPLPVLVVAPASVVDPWVEAFGDWAPHWRAVAWRGTPAKRRALAGGADVYVTSYDTARVDAHNTTTAPLAALGAHSVVADECHLIKNPHAARSHAVRRLAKLADVFVALSGTPITHHPGDLWPTLVGLDPLAWPSRERWVLRYCLTSQDDYGQTILGLHPGTEPEFRTALLGQQRRVAKADVLTQLPPKIYSVRSVQMPAAYRKAYDAMETGMLAELPDGQQLSAMGVLAQLQRLSQLASAAADVRTWFEPNADGVDTEHTQVTLKAPSWKVDALLEVLDERPGSAVVAFAPSRQLVLLAAAAAQDAGHRVGLVVGNQTAKERTRVVKAFQAGELDLICATTGAGGVGLTLTAARTAVFLQRPYSLVEALQAEDRVHRIGSEHHDSVEIVDIVATDTIDTRVRSVLREKAGQLADLVQDPRIVAELLGGATVTRLKKVS